MSKIEAVIFDWAGTTVDYGCFAPVRAFIEAFKTFGVEPTDDEVRKPMGMLKWDHIHTMMQMERITEEWKRVHGRMWTKEDVDAVYRRSERSILDILHDYAEAKPHVLETVKALREQGIKIGSTTGYTDEMMSIVVPEAKKQGYEPDAWFSPNSVGNMGRPYPYMIFRNMEALKISSVHSAVKVGDTVADIKEGINAGMISVGVIEGSSVMGLSMEEYRSLTEDRRKEECDRVRRVYEECGADHVIMDMSELCPLLASVSAD